jgi:lipoprotein NlpI
MANSRKSGDDDALAQAQSALRQRKFREAIDWATKAIEQMPHRPQPYVLRGLARGGLGSLNEAVTDFTKAIELKPDASVFLQRSHCYSELDDHTKAIADIDRALALDPRVGGAYRQRGRENFKMGAIEASIADFDRFVELEPALENELWERGLSRYYAGEFAQAQQSFEDYHKVGPSDIENGLWRMLSQAEIDGLPAAQKDLFKYEPKRRPPFPALHDLYSGRAQPKEILAHATDGAADESDRSTRTFYAHLYVGLWYVVNRDNPNAIDQLEKAVALRSTDYMWYVAHVQLERLKKAPK